MKLLAIICCILVALSASHVVGEVTRGNSGWATGIPNTTPKAPVKSETTTRGSSGWASGIPNTTPKAQTTTIYYPPQKPQRPCGPNGLGDYKGGCDDSVPVIVMPKGRPIMESVLDWFKSCLTN